MLPHAYFYYQCKFDDVSDVQISAGTLSTDDAQRILATQQDYDDYVEDCNSSGQSPFPVSSFMLDPSVADQRKKMLDDPTDGVFVSSVLNASPGEVVAATEHLVQYKCSTLPQMSGGPCK